MMNWIYVDRDSYELKFGTRPYAEHNFKGPWDCTRQERRLTFGGWEGFCVVLEESGFWGVYFDIDQNGLRGKGSGKVVIEVEMIREEIRNVPVKKKEEEVKTEEGKAAETTAQEENAEVKVEPEPGAEANTDGYRRPTVDVDVEGQTSGTVECAMEETGKIEVEKTKAKSGGY